MRKDKVAILIKKIALVIEKYSGQMLAPYDLTSTQYKIIKFLYGNTDRPIRQADIEAYFSLTNPTVTGILQNLEKKGLLRRVENPEDKRSKLLVLTERALSIKEDLYELGEAIESHVTENLSEEECEQLISLLKKLQG